VRTDCRCGFGYSKSGYYDDLDQVIEQYSIEKEKDI